MKERKNRRWRVLLIASILVLLVTGIGTLSAYLSDADKMNNVMTIGGINISIIEDFDPPEELEPGISFKKNVQFKNDGASDCYIRAKIVFTDSDMAEHCSIDINSTHYAYNEADGYYYLKNILKDGKTAPSIFTKVKLSNSINENDIKEFDILVYAEAYQTGGDDNGTWKEFNDYKEAWEHFERNK